MRRRVDASHFLAGCDDHSQSAGDVAAQGADFDVRLRQRGLRDGGQGDQRDRQRRGAKIHRGLLSLSSQAALFEGEPFALIVNKYSFERQAPKVVSRIKARVDLAERTVRRRRRRVTYIRRGSSAAGISAAAPSREELFLIRRPSPLMALDVPCGALHMHAGYSTQSFAEFVVCFHVYPVSSLFPSTVRVETARRFISQDAVRPERILIVIAIWILRPKWFRRRWRSECRFER